ncbi:MAG: hypothetical protein EAZ08_09610 [Cytophagales bacterium]|nr:MAG: hypothetical protein EAZ08_09610 [Cytophagales bacterium]
MKTKIFLLLSMAILVISSVFAQKKTSSEDDKADEKKFKKILKDLDPLQYRDMVSELQKLRGENAGMKNKLRTVGKSMTDKDGEIAKLQAAYDSISSAIAQAKSANNSSNSTNAEYAKGTWYRVQVGVKNKIDMSEVGGDGKNMIVEKDSDNIYKYTLGHFKDYWEADEFKKALRTIMGLDRKKEEDREIWTVIYNENERASMKDRVDLENANKKKGND